MAGLNKVMAIGRLGRDPETFYTSNNLAITKFSIAASEKWFDKNTGQQQERTEWIRCVSFGKPAETLAKFVSKGSQIYVEGRLQTSKYDKEGQTHYSTEVVIANFQFLDTKNNRQNNGYNPNQQNPAQQTGNPSNNYGGMSPAAPGNSDFDDGDIPF
jgi:single-strand DNA-binding protein